MSYTQSGVRGPNINTVSVRNNSSTAWSAGNLIQWDAQSFILTGGVFTPAVAPNQPWDPSYFQTGYDAVLSHSTVTTTRFACCGVAINTVSASGGIALLTRWGFVTAISSTVAITVTGRLLVPATEGGRGYVRASTPDSTNVDDWAEKGVGYALAIASAAPAFITIGK